MCNFLLRVSWNTKYFLMFNELNLIMKTQGIVILDVFLSSK